MQGVVGTSPSRAVLNTRSDVETLQQVFGMFVAGNMAFSGLAAVGSLTIVYPLDYARAHLAVRCGFWKEDLRWIVRLLVLLRGTEGCQRRGGDQQDKAHHSVCRLDDHGVRSGVSFAFGGLWPLLILAPIEMPTCESSRIWNRASTGQYRFSTMDRDSTLAAIFASTTDRTSSSPRPLELAAPVLRSCASLLVCGFKSHAGEVRGCAASDIF